MPASAERIAGIRETLRGVDPGLIYIFDETGLFYRCPPHRSYGSARERRTSRGSKATRAKDRVTEVLCVHADGSQKLLIAIIDKAMRPMCFLSPAACCPVPDFGQAEPRMYGPTIAAWFASVFVQEARRVTNENVFLVMDNSPSRGQLLADGVTIMCLQPNTTSLYQTLDMGIISAVKRRCGNKEGANKYPVATLTIQKRRTQRVDLPRGPRRRKGA